MVTDRHTTKRTVAGPRTSLPAGEARTGGETQDISHEHRAACGTAHRHEGKLSFWRNIILFMVKVLCIAKRKSRAQGACDKG